MNNRTIITLVSSLLIFAVGLFRIFTEYLSSMSLFVAYVFIITGLIGVVANGLKLKSSKHT
ncbi:hypothetical protein [Virgibacillus salexigens]|uniref:Uncharacterized protein n=1 Tax=Virgibacillus kapii TaxID=1638645 RepID=A0ABQ2DXL3_9BACI|nr:hypothetical protein [Virgibacillus kapii]GGJ77415.1 hypothetical protein GCM10007111_43780 [Virgibacillus kapii]